VTQTIAWVINRLDAIGGGERLLLEGAKYYRDRGYRVLIFTWFFDERALFGGTYENLDIIVLKTEEVARSNIIGRALSRVKTLNKLRQALAEHNVSKVFVQGEYDVALVYIATFLTGIPYRFLIFGQTFQYPHDQAKYALIFRRHLKEIVKSRPGYAETIALNPPKIPLAHRLANEFICFVRFLAVRHAERRFSFSRQIQWETELLFGCTTTITSGAFALDLLRRQDFPREVLARLQMEPGNYILSLSRLDRKKRIDSIIRGFAASGTDKILVLAGTGPDEDRLRECAINAGVAAQVIFAGYVDENEMLPLKHYAALFVSMDVGDYDISPLEALAVGTPTLCPTDFDAVAELRATAGFVIVTPEEHAIAKAITDIIAAPPAVDRSGLALWSWNTYFDTLIAD